ncbi:MAG TPA: T9SS type A sorting domain-containing protein, partial [Bacteroidales bacterium]|nr:T9SS type A sorting domain-containing protein [Bacteroidales bacterium]
IKWNYYTDPDRRNLYNNFQALISLKEKYEAFSSDNFTLYQEGMSKRLNIVHTEMDVMVLGNFDVAVRSVAANFTRTGKWYEFFRGDSVDITSSTQDLSIDLLPGEFRLYTSKRIARPSFLLSIEEPFIPDGDAGVAFEIYPNPFDDETLITFAGDDEYKLHNVEIFAADGKPVRILAVPAGIREVTWNGKTGGGSDVARGIYYVRVSTGKRSTVKKIIKL